MHFNKLFKKYISSRIAPALI